ncbi:hypothetical protein JZ751_029393 [Albula glossodonta]|uniref:Uncharacterized protein n=1 Tax=Albula glossodonta TaxID=121402 RepID=A0A8T2P8W4_9TELE|nr:hypothetical protein JZ751_029393 [Albula glossodonta]
MDVFIYDGVSGTPRSPTCACTPAQLRSLREEEVNESRSARAQGIRNMAMESSPMGMPISDPNAWATAMNNLGMAPMGMTGQPLMSAEIRDTTQDGGVGEGPLVL